MARGSQKVATQNGLELKIENQKLLVSTPIKQPNKQSKQSPKQSKLKTKKNTSTRTKGEKIWNSYELQHAQAEKLIEKLHNFPATSKVAFYPFAESNSLAFLSDREQTAFINKLISSLDTSPSHILISASIFTSRSEVAKAIGARWGGQANIGTNTQITGGRNGSIQGEAINLGQALATDFGSLSQSNINVAFGFSDENSILDLELSLLHSEGEISLLGRSSNYDTQRTNSLDIFWLRSAIPKHF